MLHKYILPVNFDKNCQYLLSFRGGHWGSIFGGIKLLLIGVSSVRLHELKA